MVKPQYWTPILLGVSAAAAGLAGGYAGTMLATNAESSNPSSSIHELLGREQAFPPSDDWPGTVSRPARDVLFEEDASRQEWASEPSTPRPRRSDWTPDTTVIEAQLNDDLERNLESVAEDKAAESDFVIQTDVDLGEDLAWEDAPAGITAEQLLNAGDQDAAQIDAAVEAVKPSEINRGDREATLDAESPGEALAPSLKIQGEDGDVPTF